MTKCSVIERRRAPSVHSPFSKADNTFVKSLLALCGEVRGASPFESQRKETFGPEWGPSIRATFEKSELGQRDARSLLTPEFAPEDQALLNSIDKLISCSELMQHREFFSSLAISSLTKCNFEREQLELALRNAKLAEEESSGSTTQAFATRKQSVADLHTMEDINTPLLTRPDRGFSPLQLT